ncbi:MAG: hypothetical protein JNK15_19345, partial [Planctomycetes bacterium]|nr:hypothetical protein [Planctomycetota bacterium]
MLRVALLLSFSAILSAQDAAPYPTPKSKKGLQVQMVDDALALGIAHAGLNVDLGALCAPAGGADCVEWEHAGERFTFRMAPVAALDAQVAPLARAGVVVTAILLAIQTGDPARDRLVVHSRCTGKAPNGIAAFQTATPEGRR